MINFVTHFSHTHGHVYVPRGIHGACKKAPYDIKTYVRNTVWNTAERLKKSTQHKYKVNRVLASYLKVRKRSTPSNRTKRVRRVHTRIDFVAVSHKKSLFCAECIASKPRIATAPVSFYTLQQV